MGLHLSGLIVAHCCTQLRACHVAPHCFALMFPMPVCPSCALRQSERLYVYTDASGSGSGDDGGSGPLAYGSTLEELATAGSVQQGEKLILSSGPLPGRAPV